ncbi:hypothetical protein MKW94_018249 [Papaver nudicaule]|uniref:Cyclin-dependent kinase inhibitor domain-containing protein n=1 Tax=Papaver nudicaule TaxID=74823 RepID=A0AA41SFD8_PAPNU|nr:hypothetical protein [Papaver nudicaule]
MKLGFMAELSKTRVGTAAITRNNVLFKNGELLGCCCSSNQSKRNLIITPELMVSPALSTNKCTNTTNSSSSGSDSCSIIMSVSGGLSSICSSSVSNKLSCDLVSGENLVLRSLGDFVVEGEKQEGFKFEKHNPPPVINHQSDSESKVLKMSSEADSKSSKLTEEKMPTETEIKDFFSAFEKHEEKRFLEKYNYDIVKDVPLEGRYEWISLKP